MIKIKSPSYYMNNRKYFNNFITKLFQQYKDDLIKDKENATCERDENEEFSIMPHQEIVRDYISIFSPYRGLLLYHGLGSGKTCSSIAIAEGLKSEKNVLVMTPASLQTNYIEELKKCGDLLYRKNQFWEFIPLTKKSELLEPLSSVLSLSVEFIIRNKGVWLTNIKKPSNFESLNAKSKKQLDKQLNHMIDNKYKFMNYNGLRMKHLHDFENKMKDKYKDNYSGNPFDNHVIIIDEAHNFVSRIVNQINKKKTKTLAIKLYEHLLNAKNVRIILLSGTPIINYPNEIAILFNILRGYINKWEISLDIKSSNKIDQNYFNKLFKTNTRAGGLLDYYEYDSKDTKLIITRNPFGFMNMSTSYLSHYGVKRDDNGMLSDKDFLRYVIKKIEGDKSNDIKTKVSDVEQLKPLPDTLDEFKELFIQSNEVTNMNLFKRRILGLTSYFKSAQEKLMPRLIMNGKSEYEIVSVEMSNHQFNIYENARAAERKEELNRHRNRKNDLFEDSSSTYRIFSRLYCNFVMPEPDIKRPLPNKTMEDTIKNKNFDEHMVDAKSEEELKENIDGVHDLDEVIKDVRKNSKDIYKENIDQVLIKLAENKDEYLIPEKLKTYSPKFLAILERLTHNDNIGCHLVYSQFRTLEGIGILKLVLDANGFAQFKLKREQEQWVLDINEENIGKPKYVLYTGTETKEEKELIRNIFNGNWKYLPSALAEQVTNLSENNFIGNLIKIFMITASGAEGISLKNVRFVHIVEPYWHPVRTKQVIGRARRICSHQDLDEELRTVKVFLYLATFTQEQLDGDGSIELKLKDTSKIDPSKPLTTDEALFEIASLKEEITNKLLH